MYFILVCIGVFVILCWIGSEWMISENYKNEHDPKKYSINRQLQIIDTAIDNLDGFQFEEFCCKVLNLGGLKSTTTPKTRDGGKDIIINDEDGTIYVECKHYADGNKISTNFIHKLVSACVIDGVNRAIFITTSSYNKEAINLVKKCNVVDIDIWYKGDILNLCRDIDMLELLDWLGYDKNEVLKYSTI